MKQIGGNNLKLSWLAWVTVSRCCLTIWQSGKATNTSKNHKVMCFCYLATKQEGLGSRACAINLSWLRPRPGLNSPVKTGLLTECECGHWAGESSSPSGPSPVSLNTTSLTSGSRRRRRECWAHTPAQIGSAGRPRGSCRVLLWPADSRRRRRATGSRCCCWRLETSAATREHTHTRQEIKTERILQDISEYDGTIGTSMLHKHSSRLDTTSENSGLSWRRDRKSIRWRVYSLKTQQRCLSGSLRSAHTV